MKKKREKERRNFERLDETGVAREMKMRHCVCLPHAPVGFVGEEGKEQRNMNTRMYKQMEN